MKISQEQWATVGKIVAPAATIIGILLGGAQLVKLFTGPTVLALVDVEEVSVSPHVRDAFAKVVDRDEIGFVIRNGVEKKESAETTLAAIAKLVDTRNVTYEALTVSYHEIFSKTFLRIAVVNDSSRVANDVKVVLPGAGKVRVFGGLMGMRRAPEDWKQEISLGSIAPGAGLVMEVWCDDPGVASLETERVAIVHRDGPGRVRYSQHFYGRDAEVVAWFLAQPTAVRYAVLGMAVLLLTLSFRHLVKRGYIAWRPGGNALVPPSSQ